MIRQILNIFHFNKLFWWIICILLVSNIVFFAAIRERQKNRINELHALYNAKRSTPTQKKDSDQAPFLQAKDDIRSFTENLPVKKDFAKTASELFLIFNKHQIDVGQTVYKPESVDYNGLFKYSTSLTINGSYKSIKALLADIQESRTLFCIEALSIASGAEEGLAEMKIKIATYFR
jgi:Tfp pilus assembly protein PilO